MVWWKNTTNSESTKSVENSQLESVENIGENIYNKNILNSLDDPMQEITGIAEKSNPHEIEAFKKEIENNGVILKRSDVERIGYAPGLKKGEPGVLYISDNASFSAWCHEMQHMRDDKALGWCGMSIIADPNIRFEWEMKAYGIEIELAKKLGRNDIVKRLADNFEKERKRIYGE